MPPRSVWARLGQLEPLLDTAVDVEAVGLGRNLDCDDEPARIKLFLRHGCRVDAGHWAHQLVLVQVQPYPAATPGYVIVAEDPPGRTGSGHIEGHSDEVAVAIARVRDTRRGFENKPGGKVAECGQMLDALVRQNHAAVARLVGVDAESGVEVRRRRWGENPVVRRLDPHLLVVVGYINDRPRRTHAPRVPETAGGADGDEKGHFVARPHENTVCYQGIVDAVEAQESVHELGTLAGIDLGENKVLLRLHLGRLEARPPLPDVLDCPHRAVRLKVVRLARVHPHDWQGVREAETVHDPAAAVVKCVGQYSSLIAHRDRDWQAVSQLSLGRDAVNQALRHPRRCLALCLAHLGNRIRIVRVKAPPENRNKVAPISDLILGLDCRHHGGRVV